MKKHLVSILFLTLILSVTSCVKSNHNLDNNDNSSNNHNDETIVNHYFNYDDVSYSKTLGNKVNHQVFDKVSYPKLDNKLRDDFAYGVDISTINEVLNHHGVFYNDYGQEQDVFEILKENGVNFIRLRLWNNPSDNKGHGYGAGNNNLETDLAIMQKAKRVGLNILLDFHYSDFWSDPGKQFIPKAWQDKTDLNHEIYQYSLDSLQYFKNHGIRIDAVQLGNEIDNGILWPKGNIDYQHYDTSMEYLSSLLNSAHKAVKDFDNNIKTIIHLACANDEYKFNRFIDNIKVDYDILGLTWYPYYQGKKEPFFNNINKVITKINKPCMIVETAYGYTFDTHEHANNIFNDNLAKKSGYEVSIQGQVNVISDALDMMSRLPNELGLGVFYWEPGWLPIEGVNAGSKYAQVYMDPNLDINNVSEWQNGWANQGLFSYQGKVMPSLKTFLETK